MPAVIVAGLFTLISAWLAYQAAMDYEAAAAQLTRQMNVMDQLKAASEQALETLSLGLYSGHSQRLEAIQQQLRHLDAAHQAALWWTYAYFIGGLLSIGIFAAVARSGDQRRQRLALGCVWLSATALLIGVTAPMLLIVTYKQLPILGPVVFQFESKGVLNALTTLWAGGHTLIALTLGAFSVAIPVIKTVVMMVLSLPDGGRQAARSWHWLHHLGKWSMADVFVVALLLTYFIGEQADFTRAEVEIGFYFFLGYAVLSLAASQLLVGAGAPAPRR